jgi:cytidylate kinase
MLDKDIADARHYDIVINTEKLSPTSTAKIIWRTFDQRRQA